jgi:hypothetical protein
MYGPNVLTSNDGEIYISENQTITYDIHTDEQKVEYDE